MPPNLNEERKLWKNDFKRIAGIDEVGRGPLAGPVVAAAVTINSKCKSQNVRLCRKFLRRRRTNAKIKNQNLKIPEFEKFRNFLSRAKRGDVQIPEFEKFRNFLSRAKRGDVQIRDSKKLSAKKREELYKLILKSPAIKWGIGKVSEKVIDKINILEATRLAMKRAVQNLEKKIERSERAPKRSKVFKKTRKEKKPRQSLQSLSIQKTSDRLFFVSIRNRTTKGKKKEKEGRKRKRKIDPVRRKRLSNGVDFLILDGRMKLDVPFPQKAIIKADEKVVSCALASIIAKVTRDKMMVGYHKIYSKYGFDCHKGYPTKRHLKMLKKYGSCLIHRKSFAPLKELC